MFAGMLKDREMRIFLVHFCAFIAVTLICAAVNIWLTPGKLWFPFVLIGWGAVVATHAFALLLRKTRRRERIFIDKKARAFAVHLFAYAATVLILLLVNVTLTPKVWWFYWVALGWGAGLAFQAWCTFFRRRRKLPSREARKTVPAPNAAPSGRAGSSAKPKPRSPQAKKKSE